MQSRINIILTNHSVDDLLLAKSKCPEIVNYKQVNSDEQFKPTLEHLKDMTSSLSGHQDYSACFQDQLERLQQLHLDQSEYVCLKALILFSSEAPGLKDPVIIDSIQERIQCALEEYDKYHYSHYQPFRFDLNKASDGSKTAVSSMSPNNIEHNEPESEIYQIQKNLDNCSKLITDNLLNSNSLFSDLWNLMPNTDRNSNLHLYFSLVRHHLNLMQNQTS
ncbi:unnamed protein product [Heterobilharzia americana]|nr:unnamed protein product [Heterobilharzia americana]